MITLEEAEELVQQIWDSDYFLNEELYDTESLKNAYKAAIFDTLHELIGIKL